MTFSFVVPVHATETLLPRCLESILSQTVDDFEVVIIDDASPGNCRAIVEGYRDPRVRYVRHAKNLGLLQARLTGLRAATGDYIVPVDSDDYVLPELLANARSAVAEGADVIVYKTAYESATGVEPAWHNHAPGRMTCDAMLEELFAGKIFWTMWGKIFRADVYRAAVAALDLDASFYVNSTEDLCQMLPIVLLGRKGVFIDYTGYRYYQNPESMTKRVASVEKIVPVAEQNVKSTSAVVAMAARLGKDETFVRRILDLRQPTIRWLLGEVDDLDAAAWNACVGQLIRIYGFADVLRAVGDRREEFMARVDGRRFAWADAAPRVVHTVAVVCVRNYGGGAERATLLWVRQMRREGKRIVWLYDEEFRDGFRAHASPGDDFDAFAIPDWEPIGRAAAIERILKEQAVDACLLPDHWKASFFTDFLAAASGGARTIIAEHNMYLFPVDAARFDMLTLRQRLYPLANVVTALSPENVAWWRAVGLENVVYMPNYLTFATTDAPPPRPPGRDLLFCGRICSRKGADRLLRVVRAVHRRHPDVRLTYVGRFDTPAFERKMRAAVDALGLSSVVTFAGEQADVAAYFRRAHFLVLASRIEGAPMVINEARSFGVPSVVFDMPYVDALDERHGVVTVPQGETDAMAAAICRVSEDGARYAALCGAAWSALREYDADRITARWRAVWRAVEAGERTVSPGCEKVASERLLALTLTSLSALRPEETFEERLNEAQDRAARRLGGAIEELTSSVAYRVGMVLTWPLRKVYRACR